MQLSVNDKANIIDAFETYNTVLDKLVVTLPIDAEARLQIIQKRDSMIYTRLKLDQPNIYEVALAKLMALINVDKDGSYFICEEATPIIDRCQAILDGKANNFDDLQNEDNG